MRLLSFIFIVSIGGCEIERPGVPDETYKEMKFIHAALTVEGCVSCHEAARPQPDAKGNLHGGGGDCSSCHYTRDDKGGWMPAKAYSHQPPPATCLGCHTGDRPALPHPPDGDCVTCHKFPSWKE